MLNRDFYQKNIEEISSEEIIKLIDGKLIPAKNYSKDTLITGVNTITNASNSEICFLTNRKYISHLASSNSKLCLIESNFLDKAKEYNDKISFIVSNNAYNDFGKILNHFYSISETKGSISSLATISDSATIKANCQISPGVVISDNVILEENSTILPNSYIGKGVTIGKNTVIGSNTVITFANIGNNVEIMHNVSIGQDGFGFSFDGAKFTKLPQLGVVKIKDNVSIGSGVAIDRGSMEDTIIGEGTKIDNLVQIGHNVQIGNNCILTGQVGIAGSTEIGNFVVLGGQTGVAGHLKIGSNNRFAAQSGITKNISDNQGDFYGMPAKKKKDWQNENIAIRKITKDLFKND